MANRRVQHCLAAQLFFLLSFKFYIHGSSMLCCARVVLPNGEYQIVRNCFKETAGLPGDASWRCCITSFGSCWLYLPAVHPCTKTSRTSQIRRPISNFSHFNFIWSLLSDRRERISHAAASAGLKHSSVASIFLAQPYR